MSEAEDLQSLQLVLRLFLYLGVLQCSQQLLEGRPVHSHCLLLHLRVRQDQHDVDGQLHLCQGVSGVTLEPLLPCLKFLLAEISMDDRL